MNLQTLHTERLTLVPLADEHLEWEIELDADPEVMRFLVGLTYVRTFPTCMCAPIEGIEEGEVEYELTREQWERRT